MQGLTLVGLNYKDDRLAALSWLNKLGNPYQAVAFDPEGKAGLDWGVYGVPESYLIDKHGVIRYKEVGPINDTVLKETLLPLIAQLQAETL
jgi:cytochrome c biogenesis protein CcmG/thiol:disulfide interchange protein DsbE